eukprot:3863376-Pyramimonas_sp.AAC.1
MCVAACVVLGRGNVSNRDAGKGDAGKGNKELSLNFQFGFPAIPPAYQISRTKVLGAKRHCSLVSMYTH